MVVQDHDYMSLKYNRNLKLAVPWSVSFGSQCLKFYWHSSKHFKTRKYHIKSILKTLENLQDLDTLGSRSHLPTVGDSFYTEVVCSDNDFIELRLATPQKFIFFSTNSNFIVGTQQGVVGSMHVLTPHPIDFSYLFASLSLLPHFQPLDYRTRQD